MDVDDRAAFGLEIQRLQHMGVAVPPSVRGAWALVMVADVVMVLGIIFTGLFMGGVGFATPLGALGFVVGMGGTFAVGLKLRRQALRVAYRGLAARLDLPSPGGVGGTTSAAFPALYSGAPKLPPPPPPLRQHDVVKPVRVGDPDAEDFDD